MAGGYDNCRLQADARHYDGRRFSLAFLLLFIGVSIRRLHDTGRSGWWGLPSWGNVIFVAQEGDDGQNEYGADPCRPKLAISDHPAFSICRYVQIEVVPAGRTSGYQLSRGIAAFSLPRPVCPCTDAGQLHNADGGVFPEAQQPDTFELDRQSRPEGKTMKQTPLTTARWGRN
jgi:hypothetical protein